MKRTTSSGWEEIPEDKGIDGTAGYDDGVSRRQTRRTSQSAGADKTDLELSERLPRDGRAATTTAPGPRTTEVFTVADAAMSANDKGAAGSGAVEGGDGVSEAAGVPEFRVYKRRWIGLVQLTLLNVIVSWDWLTYSPVVSDAATFFRTNESTINWLSTAFLFAFVFITPVVLYTLHLGPRPAIITAGVLIFLGNWIRYAGTRSSLSPDGATGGHFGVVMFGQLLNGLAQPFVLAAPARYSDLWFTHRGRVAATALMSLANPFGAALGQLIVPFWVNKSSDIPNMVLYVSIISSVCTVPCFFVYAKPPTPAGPSGQTPKMQLVESVRLLSRSLEFWLLFIPFVVFVGFFNSVSTLLNQIMEPYGYSDDDAGIGGAVLIVVGLVMAAVTSPIIDRTKAFVLTTKICVPIIAVSYLVFVWMPATRDSGGLAGPYVVLAILGASSFTLVPVAVELLVELTHPASPEVTSTLAWSGGQLLGGCFIVISDALRAGDGPDAHPPYNMKRALIFTAVLALVTMPLPLCLGLFGRRDAVRLRRVTSDQRPVGAPRVTPDEHDPSGGPVAA